MVCASCGVQNIPGAKYCDNCGLTLNNCCVSEGVDEYAHAVVLFG
ncbi:MAG: zinc-ribbon domain-containing protein [Terriglobales bacterium]